MPTHQGRGAEQVVIPHIVNEEKNIVISNIHFDTTRAHVEIAGARAVDCVIEEAYDTKNYHPFKGNFDVDKLKSLLKTHAGHVAGIIMTITNNSAGGQPVSMKNMQDVSALAKEHGITILIDGARYAENAFFVKEREEAYKNQSILQIAREAFSYADIFLMSAKKDGLVNMGGIIAIKDDEALFQKCQTLIVPMEGFPTYGGMSGRDMDALAVGLEEALDIHYLKHRTDQARYLGDRLRDAGVPVQYPIGGHAVFVDIAKILPDIPFDQFPAQSFTNALYIESGVRAVEIGSLLMGRDPDTHENIQSALEFMRLTLPRRTYTYKHLDHVADGVIEVYKHRKSLKGLALVYEPPVLRHFTAKLKPVI
jgi:tryptophanase